MKYFLILIYTLFLSSYGSIEFLAIMLIFSIIIFSINMYVYRGCNLNPDPEYQEMLIHIRWLDLVIFTVLVILCIQIAIVVIWY